MSTPTLQLRDSHGQPQDEHVDLADTELRYTGYAGRLAAVMRTIASSSGTRYLAYVSDIGEGFRPIVHPNFVKACYGLSWGYVLGDVFNETNNAWIKTQDTTEAARTGSQRLVFNVFGSMLLPMFTIHTIVHQSGNFFKKIQARPLIAKWAPVGLGLAIVPALPFMFDHPVEYACEYAWNRFWPSHYPELHQEEVGHPHEHHQHHDKI
jgi:fission process protein 1